MTCVCRIARAKQARKTLLHVLGVERTDEELGTSAAGRGGDELWQQRSRALDAPLNATKIGEVCLARACGGCRAQAQARVRLLARVIHAHMHTLAVQAPADGAAGSRREPKSWGRAAVKS